MAVLLCWIDYRHFSSITEPAIKCSPNKISLFNPLWNQMRRN